MSCITGGASQNSFGSGSAGDSIGACGNPRDYADDFLIANARLVDRDRDEMGAVFVHGGKIAAVYTGDEAERVKSDIERMSSDCGEPFYPGPPEIYDARGLVLMPAFVDLHAHFRDPGYTKKEDIMTASRAAVAGGYSTVVLMANTNPVISDQSAAEAVNARIREIGLVDSFQAVSLTRNFDGRDTTALDDLDASIVPIATEDGREVSSSSVMLEAMKKCAGRGVIVSCHCEDPDLALAAKPFREAYLRSLDANARETARASARVNAVTSVIANTNASSSLADAGRLLALAEDIMTSRNLELAFEAGCRVHIAHVSTANSLDAVRRAKVRSASAGTANFSVTGEISGEATSHLTSTVIGEATSHLTSTVSCEVTPHHLSLTNELNEIVNPPLRSEADRQALIDGILDGTVDAIATDHAPHTAEDKAAGAPGFSGIQTAFSVCYTSLVKTGRISLSLLSALMSANPASILGLKRGLLSSGYDADLVLVDPDARITVDVSGDSEKCAGECWFSLGKNTPFAGKTLDGKILATYKKGREVFRS